MAAMSFFWTMFGLFAFIRPWILPEVQHTIYEWRRRWLARLFPLQRQLHIIVNDTISDAAPNQLYTSINRYLASLSDAAKSLTAECPTDGTRIGFSLAPSQRLSDSFRGRPMQWEYVQKEETNNNRKIKSSYTLTLDKLDRNLAADYLAFVLERGRNLEYRDRQKFIFTNNWRRNWDKKSPFSPAPTFHTVAMEPEAKKALMDDLRAFMSGREYYESIGRSWKRGYLLYGPPGTGKSSLIGAIANFTGYDVYDLELTKVAGNTQLRQLLIGMTNRAILVIEDIDCSINIPNREETGKKQRRGPGGDEITLSGLLNFTDGLLSSSGRERIFVFTTNYVERLDPALIRPGRMDMHICMSHCTVSIFKSLVEIYLKGSGDSEVQKLTERYLPQIEALLEKVEVSPADVVEMLLRHKLDPKLALEEVLQKLKERKESNNVQS